MGRLKLKCGECGSDVAPCNIQGEWFPFKGAKIKVMLDCEFIALQCLNGECTEVFLSGSDCAVVDAALELTIRKTLDTNAKKEATTNEL